MCRENNLLVQLESKRKESQKVRKLLLFDLRPFLDPNDDIMHQMLSLDSFALSCEGPGIRKATVFNHPKFYTFISSAPETKLKA